MAAARLRPPARRRGRVHRRPTSRRSSYTHDLVKLGILSPERQAALVRTWGRSFARLAEWQTRLLTDVALESADPVEQVTDLASEVLPRVEALQNYVWRRHLASAGVRLMASDSAGSDTSRLAVVFVDIVGFTSRSKELDRDRAGASGSSTSRPSAPAWSSTTAAGSSRTSATRCSSSPTTSREAADAALTMTARGADPDDGFPEVRAGVAYGDVVSRLGDVFGPTVNIASRLTSIARPGSVLIDRGAHDALTGDTEDPTTTARGARARRLLVPADAAYVGEGLLAAAVVGAAPGGLTGRGPGYRPHVSL